MRDRGERAATPEASDNALLVSLCGALRCVESTLHFMDPTLTKVEAVDGVGVIAGVTLAANHRFVRVAITCL